MSGYKKDRKTSSGKKPLSHGWIVVPSKTYPDRVYFYNTVTKCSTWNNPCEELNSNSPEKSSNSTSPLQNRQRKRKYRSLSSHLIKTKANKKVAGPDVTTTENEIEDYDEEDSQFFNNFNEPSFGAAISPFSSPDPDETFKNKLEPKISKTNLTSGDEKKELWLQFATNPENPGIKKSVVMSDLNTPSTSRKNSSGESSQKTPHMKHISLADTSKDYDRKRKRKNHHSMTSKEITKKNEFKIINNVQFPKRDKTPAQTRLLELRQKNAELIKKLAKDEELCKKLEFNKSKNGAFKKDSGLFSTNDINSVDMYNNEILQKDFEEEMDWEPSSEELDVQNINEFRQKRDKNDNSLKDTLFGITSDSVMQLPYQSSTCVLVLDTNIFVSCLNFVKEIRDTNIPGLGYPILYIPWRVLQELDHLKDSEVESLKRPLGLFVRRAISYLNETFKSGHPRCFGQSFEDFYKMIDSEIGEPDNEILQTCIQLQKLHPEIKLTLLTNDKNLESKAIISNVEVYSKEGFQAKFLSSVESSGNRLSKTQSINVNLIDNIVCAVKSLMKKLIPLIVETEMKLAFNKDWLKMAYKKPPWSLQDALNCFIKHWRAVFFLIFPKDALLEAQKLYDKLFKKETATIQDVFELLVTALKFISYLGKTNEKDRLYLGILETTKNKIKALFEEVSPKKSTESNPSSESLPESSEENIVLPKNGSQFNGQQISQDIASDDIELVKSLFSYFWDDLHKFCCFLTDLLNSSCSDNSMSMAEVKFKISVVLSELNELLKIAEDVFEVNIKDLHEKHPLVLYFSDFLIKICPFMNMEIKSQLAKSLAAFFKNLEGRSLLNRSLNDFREFAQNLIRANEYLKKMYPSL